MYVVGWPEANGYEPCLFVGLFAWALACSSSNKTLVTSSSVMLLSIKEG